MVEGELCVKQMSHLDKKRKKITCGIDKRVEVKYSRTDSILQIWLNYKIDFFFLEFVHGDDGNLSLVLIL